MREFGKSISLAVRADGRGVVRDTTKGALALAVLMTCGAMAVSLAAPLAQAGVTVTQTVGLTAWPATADGATPIPQMTTAPNPGLGTVNQTVGLNTVIGETFTATQNFTLGAIAITTLGGPVGMNIGLHLYPMNSAYNPAGGFGWSPASHFAGPDLLGGGNGLTFVHPGASSSRVLTFDFTAEDEVTLTQGTVYAFEMWVTGVANSGDTIFISRAGELTTNGQIGQVTSASALSATSTNIRGFVGGGRRNMIFAVYPNNNAGPKSLTWSGAAGSVWNNSAQSFTNNSNAAAAAFTDGDAVSFTDAGAGVITLSGVLTPGTLSVGSDANYTFTGTGSIAGATSLSKNGAGTLTLATSNGFTGTTTVTAGTLSLAHSSALGGSSVVNVANNATLAAQVDVTIPTFASGSGSARIEVAASKALTVTNLTSGNNITKLGDGTLNLSGSLTYIGSTIVNGGRLNANSPVRTPNAEAHTANSGSTLNLGAAPALLAAGAGTVVGEFASITVEGGSHLLVPAVDRSVNRPSLLVTGTLSASGTLDLANNDMVVRGASEADVRTLVANWWNNGVHTTTGLTSSVAGTGSGRDALATLAVVSNDTGSGARVSTFDGFTVVQTDVLVKYTYLGDTDLDGKVDTTDLNNIVRGIQLGLTGWINGDTNYDGVVDAVDYSNLLNSLRLQGNAFSEGDLGGGVGTVPEPASLGLLLTGLPMLLRKRRSN